MTNDTRSKYDPLLIGHDVEAARRISRQVRSKQELPPSTFREFLPELSKRCLNLARHNMPQIEANSTVPDLVEKGEDERERVESIIRAGGSRTSHYTVMQHFLASLVKRGVRFTDRAVPVRDLSPTQADVDPNKVYGMADTFLRGGLRKDRILVSRDGYILDGHHRWAALALVNPARMQSVREIGMDIRDLLDESLKFPGVFKEGVGKKASQPDFRDVPSPSVRLARENHSSDKEDQAMKNDDTVLRAATIRLAHADPELRPHLLPLLAKTAAEAKPEIVSDLGYLFFVMNGIATQVDTKKSDAERKRRAPVNIYRQDHYFRIIDEIKKPFAARIKATENVPADKKDVEKLIASIKKKFDATQTPGSTMVKMLEKFLATGKRPSYAQVK